MVTMIEKVCPVCNKTFSRKPGKAKTQICCSKPCALSLRHHKTHYSVNTYDKVEQKLLSRKEIDPDTGCWNWPGKVTRHGYGHVVINKKEVAVHRLSAMFWKGFDIESELCILHKCDNPRCYNPDHLFIGTPKDNTQDMMNKGRNKYTPRRKVSDEDIHKIREIYDKGYPRGLLPTIAEEFNISTRQFYGIGKRKSWTDVV